MEKDPADLEQSRLGCPECGLPLVQGPTPFRYRGRTLGSFDGIVCESCGYGLLTEKGYEDIGGAIAALDGPAPPTC